LPPGARKPPIGDGENDDAGRGDGAAGVAGDVGVLDRGAAGAAGLNADELAGAVVGDAVVLTAVSGFLATLRFAVFLAGLLAAAFFVAVAVRFFAAVFVVFFFRPAATALLPVVLVFLAFVVFALFAMIILPIVRGDSSIAQ
jgi:hypothetical protein